MRISKLVAQRYIRRLLGNEHESLKWAWTVIMGGAFAEAAFRLSTFAPCAYNFLTSRATDLGLPLLPATPETVRKVSSICLDTNVPTLAFGMFIVFLVTFLRFFWGDNRLLDAKYKEVLGFLDDLADESSENSGFCETQFEHVLHNYSLRFIVLDAGFVIVHGVIFALLAAAVTEPFLFAYGYVFLLLFNALWLLIAAVFSIGFYDKFWDRFLDKKSLTGDMSASLAPWRWAINNLIHAAAIIWLFCRGRNELTLFGLSLPVVTWCLVLMATNCVFDFMLTWTAYFPRVRSIYYDLITDGSDEPKLDW